MKTLLVLVVYVVSSSWARIVSQDEVTQALINAGANPKDIPTWLCIVNEESHYDTQAYNGDSGDHGVFQISQIYWCSTSDQPGGGCGLTCASLRDDDISNDAQCAMHIWQEWELERGNGFEAWTTYPRCR